MAWRSSSFTQGVKLYMCLTYLCFYNDLILCYKGEVESIKLMMKGFEVFSKAPGSKASPEKTSVYCTEMSENMVNEVLDITRIGRGTMPFRYLGVSICSKRISAVECEHLIDKICARIRIWSSRNLSFSARLVLVNSVLMSIQVYWS